MKKSLKAHTILLVTLLFLFLIAVPEIYSQSNIRWKETKFNLNLNGSIGIGFNKEPEDTVDGGLGANIDLVFLNLKFFNLGISSGIFSLTNSISESENTVTCAFPINVMIIKYFRPRGWDIFPYCHLSPGLYLKTNLVFQRESTPDTTYTIVAAEEDAENEIKIGTGFSTGFGMFFALNKNLFLNCGLRYHLLWVDEDFYNILSNSIGLSLSY